VAHPSNYRRAAGARGEAWDKQPFEALDAVLAKAPVQCVWGGNHYALPLSRGWLVWHKPDALPSMADVELAWTNLDCNARHFSRSTAATNAERVGHPTQKPLALMLWCIAQLARPRSILDPFMGTGTTGVAASMLGCAFTGIEIEERYFDISCERIENAQRQAPLMTDRMWLDECMPASLPLPFEGDLA
jgi:site-specific DNA-methyltransferase (adenine-specific)/modification methylase